MADHVIHVFVTASFAPFGRDHHGHTPAAVARMAGDGNEERKLAGRKSGWLIGTPKIEETVPQKYHLLHNTVEEETPKNLHCLYETHDKMGTD